MWVVVCLLSRVCSIDCDAGEGPSRASAVVVLPELSRRFLNIAAVFLEGN